MKKLKAFKKFFIQRLANKFLIFYRLINFKNIELIMLFMDRHNYDERISGQIYEENDFSGERVIRRINSQTGELEELVQGGIGKYWARSDSVIRCGYGIVFDFDD